VFGLYNTILVNNRAGTYYRPVLLGGNIAPTQVDKPGDLALYAALVADVFNGSYAAAANLVNSADIVGGAFERHKTAANQIMDRWEAVIADTKFQSLDLSLAIH
jgi:hypothetical protein